MKKTGEKVLVAMSGGVDSSVVAALLVKAGYNVTGAFMVNYDKNGCWRADYQDALRVAAKLGIPLLRMNFVKEYKEFVLDYMYKEYKKGRTPNPDVLCNKFVKFGVWLKAVNKLGFKYLATGHYARVIRNKEKGIRKKGELKNLFFTPYSLLLSKDQNKDQTYFLNQLNQKQLSKVLFPLGKYTKPEVRKLAKKFLLPTAEKEESMGICFIGEVPMKEFLEAKIKSKPGKIIMSDGTVLGTHDGLSFYTIGQRHGFLSSREVAQATARDLSKNITAQIKLSSCKPKNISSERFLDFQARNESSKPLYVVAKDIKKNCLVVGYENDPLLYKKEIAVTDLNWISGQTPKFPLKCEVRLRHRQQLQKAKISSKKGKGIIVDFKISQRAPTPGQFAVFYLKGECLGGGIIED